MQPSNSSNILNNQIDNDSKLKNQDNFNGAPAQPAQSFNLNASILNTPNNNQPPAKKGGFEFIIFSKLNAYHHLFYWYKDDPFTKFKEMH